MTDKITFQNNTAYNASDLNGTSTPTLMFNAYLVWFDATGSYDGTATWEFSPDSGTTWFGIEAVELNDSTSFATSQASPADTNIFVIHTPSQGTLRVRMSGGTQGSLSVYGRGIYFNR